jgi:hypothetical protein
LESHTYKAIEVKCTPGVCLTQHFLFGIKIITMELFLITLFDCHVQIRKKNYRERKLNDHENAFRLTFLPPLIVTLESIKIADPSDAIIRRCKGVI